MPTIIVNFFRFVIPGSVSWVSRNWKSVLISIGVLSAASFSLTAAFGSAFETIKSFQILFYLLVLIVALIAGIRIYFYVVDERTKRKK